MKWLSKNANSVEALASVATAIVAIAALIGIKYQLEAADRIQKAQTAREAYRSHLALSVANPSFAMPDDACKLNDGANAGAYISYVDHLLYSAEQMLEVEPGWETTFEEALQPHASYICSENVELGATDKVEDLINDFRGKICTKVPKC